VVIINYRAITPTEEPTESQTRGMCPTISICLSDEVIVCTVIKKKLRSANYDRCMIYIRHIYLLTLEEFSAEVWR